MRNRPFFISGRLASLLFAGGILLLPWQAWAQVTDSLLVLGEIRIEAESADSPSEQGVFRVNPRRLVAHISQDVVRLLDHVPGLDIRRYGSSGAALASFRGLGAASTRIELDGIRLMDPASGSFDITLLPAPIVQSLSSRTGATSGASPGGVLQFETTESTTTTASLEAGAFGRFAVHGQSGFAASKTAVFGALTASRVAGDFPYDDPVQLGHPRVRRQGADRQNASFLLSARHEIDGRSEQSWLRNPVRLRFLTLISHVDRSIPALSNARAPGVGQIDDLQIRALSASTQRAGMPIHATLSTNHSEFRYQPAGRDTTRVANRERALRIRIAKVLADAWLISMEQHVQQSRVTTSDDFMVTESGTRMTLDHVRSALLAGVFLDTRVRKTHRPGGHVLRQSESMLAPGLWAAYRLGGGVQLRAALARVARFPTLNERFWVPGGNADLAAEHGFQAEWGASWHRTDPQMHVRVVAFVSRMSNRISWRPALAANARQIWTPDNISRVTGHGLEGNLTWAVYPFLRATMSGSWLVQEDYSNPLAASYGHQLRFAPPWKGAFELDYTTRWLGGFITVRKIGRRFTATDESSWIAPQGSIDAGMVLSRRVGPAHWSLSLSGLNLSDARLESSPWMPMPGREWRLLLRLNQ